MRSPGIQRGLLRRIYLRRWKKITSVELSRRLTLWSYRHIIYREGPITQCSCSHSMQNNIRGSSCCLYGVHSVSIGRKRRWSEQCQSCCICRKADKWTSTSAKCGWLGIILLRFSRQCGQVCNHGTSVLVDRVILEHCDTNGYCDTDDNNAQDD